MTIAEIIRLAKGQYGMKFGNSEDSVFTNPFMLEIYNDSARWLASIARCHFNPDVELSFTGGSTYADWVEDLGANVIEPVSTSFRWKFNSGQSTWTPVTARLYESLLTEYTALENVAAVNFSP